ncbi:MAG: hypothetical protein P1V97_11260 [Planctomycetota bacterium]|nr:hypothetical protein [Planctomycetota bacterium]
MTTAKHAIFWPPSREWRLGVALRSRKWSPAGTERRTLKLKWHDLACRLFNKDTMGLFVLDENNKKLGCFNFRQGKDRVLGPVIGAVFLGELLPMHTLTYALRTMTPSP